MDLEVAKLRRQAVSLSVAGRHKEAAQVIERALQLAPDDAPLALRLADTRRRIGDIPGAIDAYARAAALFKAAGHDHKSEAMTRLVGELNERAQERPRAPLWKRIFGNA
jgi:tetratricopeptide (TPR) repeat protein